MKIHPSTVVVPLAVVLLVGAAGAVLATSGTPAPAGGSGAQPAAESASPSTAPAATTKPEREAPKDTALTDALDKLVADGTITSAQRDKILSTVQAERQARIDAWKAEREAAKAERDKIRGFLEDGVITQQEFDQLSPDSPLRKLTTLMDDGKITTDELQELGRGFFLGGGNGRGHGFGHWFKGDKPDEPAATASPAP